MTTELRANLVTEIRKQVLRELLRKDKDAYKKAVHDLIVSSLHEKQQEVFDALARGETYIALCCSRRAGKTYFLACLIILTLLHAGHNQSVVFAAPTLSDGRDLIWPELSRLIDELQLPWELKEHLGRIETPEGAFFKIMGLNKAGHAGKPRGLETLLFLCDESQDMEHLLPALVSAVGPALVNRRGAFIASGTPGMAEQGWWYEVNQNQRGFMHMGWSIDQNPKLTRPGEEILREVREKFGWDENHPEYLREYKGLWVEDTNLSVFDYRNNRNAIYELPDDYSVETWKHVIGMDYGFSSPCGWAVVAVNPYDNERIVVHAEKGADTDGDYAAEVTARLVREYRSTLVVCDPGGGGVGWLKKFNATNAKRLGCQVKEAYKVHKPGQIEMVNVELRTARLKFLRPDSFAAKDTCADPVVKELQVLRYTDATKSDIVTGKAYEDHASDALRYALVECVAWTSKDRPKVPTPDELEAKAIADRNRRARAANRGPLWRR
jgi:hypothetical protein